MRAHVDRGRKLAVTQDLHRVLGLDYTGLAQNIGIDRGLSQFDQTLQAYDVVFLAEDVGETALRHAAMQRHLAAFKSADHARAAARTLPFVAASRSLAHARPHTAPYAFALLGSLLRSSNIR